SRARDRLPLRRPVGRGCDRAPERDERARATSLAALVLLRPRLAGAGAQGLGRQGGKRRGRATRLLPPSQNEQRGPNGHVRTGDGARSSNGLANELAARSDDQPGAAEFDDVLAADLPRLCVADVVVERPAVISDLAAAVAALGRADQRALDAGARSQRPFRVIDRPGLCAGAVASAAAVLVSRERVEHVPVAVE